MSSIEKFLNKYEVKSNLMFASLYLSAYELLKDSILGRIKDFFSFEYVNEQLIVDAQYDLEVTNRHKDLLFASCLWLESNNAITLNDIDEIKMLRQHRNRIATNFQDCSLIQT